MPPPPTRSSATGWLSATAISPSTTDLPTAGRSASPIQRKVLIDSRFGETLIIVTDGHLAYPFGHDAMGYAVANLTRTLAKAKSAGARVLLAPYRDPGLATAIAEFPGGYICELRQSTSQAPRALLPCPWERGLNRPPRRERNPCSAAPAPVEEQHFSRRDGSASADHGLDGPGPSHDRVEDSQGLQDRGEGQRCQSRHVPAARRVFSANVDVATRVALAVARARCGSTTGRGCTTSSRRAASRPAASGGCVASR